MAPRSTLWPLEKHTAAKHQILRRYLGAWFAIMSKWNKRILYIDGFAGPGEYEGGEPGSPLIALDTALSHTARLSEIVFLFIEQRSDRCAHLQQLLDQQDLSEVNVRVPPVICGTFDEQLNSVLNYLAQQNRSLAPTFAFIDPFGYSDTPLSVIRQIMAHDKCEMLITFMYQFINRFVAHRDPQQHAHYDALFGTREWRRAHQMSDATERRHFLHNLYRDQLRSAAGIQYVRSFEMIDGGNQTEYFLLFGTNAYAGLKKMKEAMWSADPTSGLQFSDATDPSQLVLFEAQPDFGVLRRLILDWARGRRKSVEEIERFVVEKTPFKHTHYKTQVLQPLEKAGGISVSRPGKRGYPKGTLVQF